MHTDTYVYECKNSCCSAAQSCLTLCDPMDCSPPGFPVHHRLPELAQTHVHQVSDAIQPFCFFIYSTFQFRLAIISSVPKSHMA